MDQLTERVIETNQSIKAFNKLSKRLDKKLKRKELVSYLVFFDLSLQNDSVQSFGSSFSSSPTKLRGIAVKMSTRFREIESKQKKDNRAFVKVY